MRFGNNLLSCAQKIYETSQHLKCHFPFHQFLFQPFQILPPLLQTPLFQNHLPLPYQYRSLLLCLMGPILFFHPFQPLPHLHPHRPLHQHHTPSPLFKNKYISSKRTLPTSPTLISALRLLLAIALLENPSNAYFALLSHHLHHPPKHHQTRNNLNSISNPYK